MRNKALCVSLVILGILLSGCSDYEEVPTIVVNTEEESLSYTFSTVTVDNVVSTKKFDCKYKQTKEQEISFLTTGKYVDKVYVREGDTVKKGTLLCELSSDALESEIENLQYSINRNTLLLGYLDERESIDIQYAWINSSGNTEDTKKQVSEIQKNYDKQRQTYNDSLEFDKLELEEKEKLLGESRLYSTMNGIVYDIKSNLVGSTSKAGEVIMTIVDASDGLFEADLKEDVSYFKDGESYNLTVNYGKSVGEYEVTPYEIENWSEGIGTFSIVIAPEGVSLEVGTIGSLEIVEESRENVLTLPKTVVHEADGATYVYVVNEDNMREVKWIKTGLEGDENIEILEGLSEGDKVVKK